MADTASLVARVKTEGAEQAAKQLDNMASSANSADAAVNKLTPDVNKVNQATGKAASDGFSKFKSAAGQVGFQVQDMVVQLQSGTSAFVAIGQQGSQLAGAFGPGGAVLGAVIALASAVGGVLYKSMGDATISTKELEAAQKDLQAVLQRTESGAYKAADALAVLIKNGATSAVVDAKVATAKQATVDLLNAQQQAAKDAAKAGDTLTYGSAIGAEQSLKTGAAASSLTGYVDTLSKKFGVTADEAKQLIPLLADVQKKSDEKSVAALGVATDVLSKKYNNQNKELTTLNGTIQTANQAVVEQASQQKALSTIVEDTRKQQEKSNESYIKGIENRSLRGKEAIQAETQVTISAIREREGLSEAERQRAISAAEKAGQTEIAELEKRESDKNSRLETSAAKRASSEAKHQETLAKQQQKAANSFLDTLDRSGIDQIKKIDAMEQQKLKKLQEYQQQGVIVGQQFEDAKTAIMLNADEARQQELDKRKKKQDEADLKFDTFTANIQARNAAELEMIDIQTKERLKRLDEYYKNAKDKEKEYNDAKKAIADQAEKEKMDVAKKYLGETTDNLKTALGEGNAAYKAFAIANTIMQTYQSATAAFSALAPIPFVGPVLGGIAAGAAVAAGLANVAKIRSARYQGGNLAAGQASTIAEHGKPEVIMPAGSSRVRTAQQMKQIMGEDSANKKGGDSVIIVNNTTGRIDEAKTERDDEGRLRVIISETVSSALMDSNSDIAKSRRGTRGQAGF